MGGQLDECSMQNDQVVGVFGGGEDVLAEEHIGRDHVARTGVVPALRKYARMTTRMIIKTLLINRYFSMSDSKKSVLVIRTYPQ